MTSTSPSEAARLADIAAWLCSVPSVTGAEEALCDALLARLARPAAQAGLRTTRVRNSFALLPAQPMAPLVLLIGHLDTVPPQQTGPVRVDDGWLFGTGASDMKAGVALMVAALEDDLARASDLALGYVFYDREEGPYADNGLGPLLEALPELRAAALGLCLEPSNNALQVGCVGSMQVRLTVSGRRAHAARPWEGDNAIARALPLLGDLTALRPRDVDVGGLRFRDVWTVTQAIADGARNVVPDRFVLNLNVRHAPGRTTEEAERELADIVAGRAQVEVFDRSPPGRVCLDNPLVDRLRARNALRVEPKQAWTDVGRLSAAGIDAVNFGPGDPAFAHQADERVAVAALAEGYAMLARFVAGPEGSWKD